VRKSEVDRTLRPAVRLRAGRVRGWVYDYGVMSLPIPAMRGAPRVNARFTFLLLLPPLIAALLTGCSSGKQVAERLNRDANRLYTARDFPGALETYRKAEVLRPDLPAINYNTGNTLNQQSDFERAVAEDRQATQSTDAEVQDRAYYSMGNAFVRSNQLRDAIDAYKSALRAKPSDQDAKYNLEVIQQRLAQQDARRQQIQESDQSDQSGQADTAQQGQEQAGQSGAQGDAADTGQQPQAGQASGAAQAGQPQGSTASASAGGYTGTPAGQAAALDPALKKALDQFNQTGNVDDALRALDIAGQQQRIQQAGGGSPPKPQGRDW
jgi:tetratricopeptide (TPR) repeat protein